MNLHERSDEELLSDVTTLVGSHRELTAKLLADLAEIEERRLHLLSGYSSMFDFCRKKLGMSEGEAFRRILAARLSRRFPLVLPLLASGSVNLSTLELVSGHLTDENHVELLEAVSGKSKREVLMLLAARFPKPDVRTSIRKLPEHAASDETRRSATGSTGSPGLTFALEAMPSGRGSERARIEPLSPGRYKVEFTASAELCEKLELCRDLMSHANPSRELGIVVERALDLLLTDLEKKRLGKRIRPQREPALRSGEPKNSDARPGRITRATRRQVFERDQLQCTYVSSEGRRCEARAFLELDHETPRALGGADSLENLRVLCRAHNQLAAEKVFGREHVARRRYFFRQKREPDRPRDEFEKREAQGASASITKRIRLALKSMGFREDEALRAISQVQRTHEELDVLPIEQTLREAVLVATADTPG